MTMDVIVTVVRMPSDGIVLHSVLYAIDVGLVATTVNF